MRLVDLERVTKLVEELRELRASQAKLNEGVKDFEVRFGASELGMGHSDYVTVSVHNFTEFPALNELVRQTLKNQIAELTEALRQLGVSAIEG